MYVCPNATVVAAMNQIMAGGAYSSPQLVEWVIERMWQALLEAPETREMNFSQVVVFGGKGRTTAVALGLVVRLYELYRLRVKVVLAEGQAALCPEAASQLAKLPTGSATEPLVPGPDTLIIDGLLSTGTRGVLKTEYSNKVKELNDLRRRNPRNIVVSVDMPTGMDPGTGVRGDDVVLADMTLAVGAARPWMLEDGAEEYIGALLGVLLPIVPGLGVPIPLSREQVTDADTVLGWLARRSRSIHKYGAGKVTVIAGSRGMVGAAQMCAEGALTAGAGLVTLYCPEDVFAILATRVAPEVMVRSLSDITDVRNFVDEASRDEGVLVAGPGVGQTFPMQMLKDVVEAWPRDNVMVLDAGGLVQAFREHWQIGGNPVFTPHRGELQKMDPFVISKGSRKVTVDNFLRKYKGTLLYKGARTIVSNRAEYYINSTGGPWMAGAGQGDILAGVIGGLAAQGVPPVRAAALAAYACGLAATDAWRASGYPPAVRATALLPYLPGRLA